jgi:hypothetical protein
MKWLFQLISALYRAYTPGSLFGQTTVLNFKSECRDSDGKLRWTDDVNLPVVIAGNILPLLGLFVALSLLVPYGSWIALGLVTTAGLNKLLDATVKTGLTSPAWYVGLIGAKVTDGAMTASSATLTSASNPFASGDVGLHIIVRGAGAAGADLYTTISAYTNAGQVTLAATAGTTVSGAGVAFDPRPADTMASHSFVSVTPFSNSTRPAWTPGSISAGSVSNSGSPAVFTVNASSYVFGAFLADDSGVSGTTGTLYGGSMFTGGIARQVASGDTLTVTGTLTVTAA